MGILNAGSVWPRSIARCGATVIACAIACALAAAPPPQQAPSASGGSTGWPPTQSGTLGIGLAAPTIALNDTQGNAVTSAQFAGKPAVLVWVSPQCATCTSLLDGGAFASTIAQAKQLDPATVILFINSSAAIANAGSVTRGMLDSRGIHATALLDPSGATAKAYGVQATPHCFVIDSKGAIAYAGALDDKAGTNHVVAALRALKEKKPVSPTVTKPYGTPLAPN